MDGPSPLLVRRASAAWTVVASLCLVAALALAVFAADYQAGASAPRGEGELFLDEAGTARELLLLGRSSGLDDGTTVRRIRNLLMIESVSVAAGDGMYTASTSPNLVGLRLEPPFLSAMLAGGRFGAITTTIEQPLKLDGVEEWSAGDSLYLVSQPITADQALILAYDVSELLARRSEQAGIRPLTIQLAGMAAVLVVFGVILLVGRAGARRRIAEARRESERMQQRARELSTHNRQLDEARRDAEEALELAEETNRIRSEFVLMINHELRTPLTAVVTGAELLLLDDELAPADRRELATHMVRDGRRLQELIAQMLTVARIENRGLGYTLRPVALEEVIGRLAALHGEGLFGEHCPTEAAGWELWTDPDPLVHLVLSLADNALTHGASTVRLEVAGTLPFIPKLVVGHMPADAVCLLVKDDGPGVDPAFLPRAFEKFEKQSRSSGTGLGLYMARLIVEAIEGAIAVDTGPNGTTMAVIVPRAAQPAREAVA